MSMDTGFLVLAILVTATAVAPVAAAVLAHRDSSIARWIRRRVRWVWAIVASLWLLSLALKLNRGGAFPQIDVIVSSLGFVAALGAAFFHRPDPQSQVPSRAA